MKIQTFVHRATLMATLAAMSLVFDAAAIAASQPVTLPTGATITPDAAPGSFLQPLVASLPDYPSYGPDSAEATAVSPDGKTLLVLTSGYNYLLDANGSAQAQDSSEFVFVEDISSPSVPVLKQVVLVPNAFSGLVFSPDGSKFYVAGGVDDSVHTYTLSNGSWAEVSSAISLGHKGGLMNLETQVGPTAAGVGITADGGTLVVANYETDSVTAVDVVKGAVLAEYDLRPGLINSAQAGVPGGEFPVGITIKGNNTVYVSSARDREIDVLNLSSGTLKLTRRIRVAGNPNRMVLNRAQSKLFVTSDNADSLIVISTAENEVLAQVNTTAPRGMVGNEDGVPKGSNPNSVTLSKDEKTAYVTNAGTNSVAVINLSGRRPKVTGLIPTGWQPNSASISPDGSTIYVVNGRSNTGPDLLNCRFINAGGNYGSGCQSVSAQNGSANQYAWQGMHATLLVVPAPGADDLSQLTSQVAENNGFNLQLSEQARSTMRFLHEHIKHVIYIVKENRTYDQILGDLPFGNGDPSLTQFPQAVTPNFHALATNFVDFDNFYDSGSASMEGWQWSTAARAMDLNEKSQVVNYGKGGSNYDSEGPSRNINVGLTGVTARKAWQPFYPADPNLLPGTANEVAPDGPEGEQGLGYIWDAAIRAHLTVRNYGFFSDLGSGFQVPASIIEPCASNPPVRVSFPGQVSLVPRTDACFRGYDNRFPDFYREKEWAREFDNYVSTNSLPALETVRLPHDHFGSFGSAVLGVNTPELQMADNDYAVGRLIDKVAHSKYANSTLIFVVEDDSQDGADHVSSNRSTAFIVGPYVKHGGVSSAHYTTVSMLRTITDVLGLEKLGLHAAGLPPMTEAFDTTQGTWTFNAVPALVLFNTQLPLTTTAKINLSAIPKPTHDAAWWEAHTKQFDFSAEDRVNPAAFNRVIWQGLKGDVPYPTNRSGANLRRNRDQSRKPAAVGSGN